ncbi:MAG: hypothetical protein WC967_13330 [Balneolaceae bacterium]
MADFIFNKPREVGEILTDTFQYIRLHYKSLGKALFFFAIPLYILQVALISGTSIDIIQILNNPEDTAAIESIFTGKYFLSIIVSILATCVLSAVTLKHVQLTSTNQEVDSNILSNNLVANTLNFLGLYLIIGLTVFFSMFAFMIPAIFIGIHWSLAPAALQIEEQGVLNALRRSWDLIKGYWWITFALFVVMYLITVFSTYILIIPTTIISLLIAESGASSGGGFIPSLYTIIISFATIISSLLYAIMHIAFSLHYFNIKERKEGGSLRSKIEQLSL